MRKHYAVTLWVLALASFAMAQTAGETKWHCDKPTTQNQLDVPDGSGYQYIIAQGKCTATSSTMGEKTGEFTEFQDASKTKFTNHGRFVSTKDNGDKVYYNYQGSGDRASKTATNKWKVTGGTGKSKSAGLSGSCKGTLSDDGATDWTCTAAASKAK